MNYIGDYKAGSNVHVFFSTNDGSGQRVSFASAIEVADFRIYKNVSTTKRSSQNGWTLDETHDAVIGVHSIKIDLSDDTDAGFYAAGNDYTVVLYPNETVDGQSVSAVLAQFSIENRMGIPEMVWDTVLTGATHNVATSAGRRLRGLQQFGGYEGGAVWLNTVGGVAGTESGENGTVNNPVDSLADALTLLASENLKIIHILPGSSVTFAASMANLEVIGFDYTIALGGQNCNQMLIVNATVSGTFTGTPNFRNCTMSAIVGPSANLMGCGLASSITQDAVGDWFLDQCFSKIAGTATPSFDLGAAVATSNINFRHYSGGLEVENVGQSAVDNMTLEGHGQLIINANCVGGTIAIRGHFDLTDNAGGAVTLSDDARFDIDAVWSRTRSGELASLPSQTVPSAEDQLAFVYQYFRNRGVSSPSQKVQYKADGTTPLATWTQSEVAGIFDQDPTA